ncbi:MAG: site-specific integrase [Planctomycetales bacterium]|nr:site-specific integrase [Planctomycetales bacterium]
MSTSASLRIPKYQHFKARNLAKVRLDGKDFYLGTYNSPESRAEYKRVIAEWLAGKKAPQQEEKPASVTVCELMVSYLRHAGQYYVKDGQQTREFGCIKEACTPLRQLYESTLVDDFGPLCLQALREAMIRLGWSRKYINKQVSRVRRMFRYGVSQELVKPETYQALAAVPDLRKGRTTAHDNEPVSSVSDAVVNATLPELSQMVADMVRVQRFTGCRPTEVCLLRPGAIERHGDVWFYTPDQHKTEHQDRQRVIFIGPNAQEVLIGYTDRADHEFCFDPREAPLARKNARERYTKDSYGRAVRRAVDRINRRRIEKNGDEAVLLEKWSPNRLRHSAATEIRREFGIEGAQVILGHSSADVTQVYAERDLQLAVDIARRLG